jgi:hypothetical protein
VAFLIVVILFTVANAAAARSVSGRWGIDAAVPWPSLGLALAIDATILIVYGFVAGPWSVVAVLPIVATLVLVLLRVWPRRERSQPSPR